MFATDKLWRAVFAVLEFSQHWPANFVRKGLPPLCQHPFESLFAYRYLTGAKPANYASAAIRWITKKHCFLLYPPLYRNSLLMSHTVISTYHRRSKRRGEPNCSGHCRPSQARFHFGIVMCENGFRPPAAPYPIRVIFKLELSRADCTSHCHKILKSVGGHEIRPSFPMLKLLTFGTALGAAAAFSPFMVNFLSPFVPARFLQYFRDVLNLEILSHCLTSK